MRVRVCVHIMCNYGSYVCVWQGKDTKRIKLTQTDEILEVDEEDLEKVSHMTVICENMRFVFKSVLEAPQ